MGLSLAFASWSVVRGYPDVVHTSGQLVLSRAGFAISFSDLNGSILSVTPGGQTGTVFKSGELGLWNVTFKEGGTLNASTFSANSTSSSFTWTADPSGNTLQLGYSNAALAVTVNVTGRDDGVDFAAQVRPSQKTVLELALPGRLRFSPAALQRLVCPLNSNESAGAAFKSSFFQSQPESAPAGWSAVMKGPSGYTTLYGGPAITRADNDPPVPLTVTTNGQAWLGAPVANRWNGTNAAVNRPPAPGQADLVLVDSTNGPFFSASHLGGQGCLFRLGGPVGESQQALALDLVLGAIEHLAQSAPAGRTKVGLVALTRGPASGGWATTTVSQWRDRLQASATLARAGVEIVEIAAAQPLLDALMATNFLAILNPYGEWTPVLERTGMTGMVNAVGSHVRAGGNWFEVGGYSFYYELRPNHYYTYATPYPPAFADFLHFESAIGTASLYGVQPQGGEPWVGSNRLSAIFVPGRLAWGADAQGGYGERAFGTFVSPGQPWQSPVVRLTVGQGVGDALLGYCQANQFSRRLEDKMTPEVLDRFRRSLLVYYDGSCTNKLAHLEQLPSPALVHFADYLMGGFDKEYPDHLPVNPSFGTPEDFSVFFDQCHQLGLLVMPYTNPTWWCDHPRGPTFLRESEAPLLKRFDGSLSYEIYGSNDGYTVCHWHPGVRAANRLTVQQFTTNYPVDVLFQDQCGARTWQYDTNPASPMPYAYADGLISMVSEDSRTKPLSTENGWDRIVNYESQLCGMTWAIVPTEGAPSWRTFMRDRFAPETWDIFPLAQYIAHDKAAMIHHDLGQFVTDDEVLSWSLGLGYGLSCRVDSGNMDPPTLEWLRWLDRLQKSICARYIGQPVRAFVQDRGTNLPTEPDGVLRASYGPVDVVANLGPSAHTESGRELAPFGFCATAPGVIAAHLNSPGTSNVVQGVSFIAEEVAGTTELWIYSGGDRQVTLELPRSLNGTASVTLDGGATTNLPVQNGKLTLDLGYKPNQQRLLPPAELDGKAPRDWPLPKPAIGVLNLAGMPRSWTQITPADWVQAFGSSRLATEFGVPIRQITDLTQLVAALQAGPTAWLAIINPSGEIFPSTGLGAWQATLSRVRDYVNHGGSWWETAGYSFYVSGFAQAGTWQTETIGPSGMSYFGLPVGGGDVAQAAEPLTVTALGQTVFGADLAARLQGLTSVVNRGLVRTSDDPGHLTLLAGAQQDFLGAYRLDGWGYLWRVGGFWPNRNVVLPAAAATMEYIYTHPPLPFESGPTRYLWHGQAVLKSRPVLKQASVTNGAFGFSIGNCTPGATNVVERSLEATGQDAWQEVFTFLSPLNETNWADPEAAGLPKAFYRVKTLVGN